MPSDSGPGRKFWQIPLADLEKQLAAGGNGLTSTEAAERRLRYGSNTLEERRHLSLGTWFGFAPPSALFLLAIGGLTVSYLLFAQGAKWAFFRLSRPAGSPVPLIRVQLPLIGRS